MKAVAQYPMPPLRVLLVEPGDPELPFDVLSARDFGDALCWTGEFDAILFDLDVHGLESVSRAQGTGVPVVVLTAGEELGAEAVHRGADEFVAKGGATPSVLAHAVRSAVERFHSILNLAGVGRSRWSIAWEGGDRSRRGPLCGRRSV